METFIWSMIIVVAILLGFLYFVIRETVRRVTSAEINEKLQMAGKPTRGPDQVKKDRLRHYFEAFSWVPVSFALFLAYASIKAVFKYFQKPEGTYYLGLVIASFCCFLFFLGLYLFIVSLSKKGDLRAAGNESQTKSNYVLLIGSPIFEWVTLSGILYIFQV